jgi:hypothetical protein
MKVDSNNVSTPIYQFGQAPNASAVQQLNTCTAKTFRVTAYLDATATSLNPAIPNSNPPATQSRSGRKVALGRSSNTRPITDYGVEEIQVGITALVMAKSINIVAAVVVVVVVIVIVDVVVVVVVFVVVVISCFKRTFLKFRMFVGKLLLFLFIRLFILYRRL